MALHDTVARVTDRIVARSAASRAAYLERMRIAGDRGPARAHLSCSGQAHAYAAAGEDQAKLAEGGLSIYPLSLCKVEIKLIMTKTFGLFLNLC